MGSNGPVSLNMLAINQAMVDYNVEADEKIEFSLKVRRIANVIISAQTEEAMQKIKQKK